MKLILKMLAPYFAVGIFWCVFCFVGLSGASIAWQKMGRHANSILVPYLSHALADIGVVIAALLRM